MLRNILFIAFLLGLGSSAIAEETLEDKVIRDFGPKTAVVVSGPASESRQIYIDLGKLDGIRVGDLFSVSGPEQTVKHPSTGVEITLESEASALVGVTRINEDYASAVVIDGPSPETGQEVRRFRGLKAYFIDPSGKGRELYTELRTQLSHIEWLGYSLQDEADLPDGFNGLIFRYTASKLTTDYTSSWPVASYPIEGNSDAVSAQRASELYQLEGLPSLPYPERLASLPIQPVSSDILVKDKRLLIAAGTMDQITVISYPGVDTQPEENATQVVSFSVPHRNRLLAVRWWQPKGHPKPFLALTTWDGLNVEGMLMELDGNQVTEFRTDLPFILGTFDLDRNQIAESLLGQSFNRNDFFGQPVHQFSISAENTLQQHSPSLPLPPSFKVLGSLIADLTGDGKFEYIVIHDQRLVVRDSAGSVIHKSERDVGTGLSSLSYDLYPDRPFSPVVDINIEASPLVRDASGNQKQLLIFPRRGTSGDTFSQATSSATTNRFGALVFDRDRFMESTVPYRLEGKIAAMALDGSEIRILLSTPDSGNEPGAELLSLSAKSR
ncbi:hypothetical protein [Marinobacter sp.]|uniref:hypothetical protein n=1 Tax=Marinobacter sp. TaxID=50741 RepID=UPI003B52CF44